MVPLSFFAKRIPFDGEWVLRTESGIYELFFFPKIVCRKYEWKQQMDFVQINAEKRITQQNPKIESVRLVNVLMDLSFYRIVVHSLFPFGSFLFSLSFSLSLYCAVLSSAYVVV